MASYEKANEIPETDLLPRNPLHLASTESQNGQLGFGGAQDLRKLPGNRFSRRVPHGPLPQEPKNPHANQRTAFTGGRLHLHCVETFGNEQHLDGPAGPGRRQVPVRRP